jgi:DNA-binding CsgD family transcriptional regulator
VANPTPVRYGQPLTPKEAAVLRHVAGGRTNASIGRAMYLSEDTVKSHLLRVYRKLGATNRAHAVALAYQQGVLTIRRVHAARPATHLERAS